MGTLLGILVALVIMGLFFYAFIWFIGWAGLPEPFNMILKVLVGLFFLLYLLGVLTGAAPAPTHMFTNSGPLWK